MPARKGSKRNRKQAASSDEPAADNEAEQTQEEPPKKRGRPRGKKTASVSTTVTRRRSSRRQSKKTAEEAEEAKDDGSDNTSEDTTETTTTRKTRSARRNRKSSDAAESTEQAEESPDVTMADNSKNSSRSGTGKKRNAKKSLTKGQLEKENENLKEEVNFLKGKLSEVQVSLEQSYPIPDIIDVDTLDDEKVEAFEHNLEEDNPAREILSTSNPAMVDVTINESTFNEYSDKLSGHGETADEWNNSLGALSEKVSQIQEESSNLQSDPRILLGKGKKSGGLLLEEETQSSTDLINQHANNLELLRSVGGDLLSAREFFHTNHVSLDTLEKEASEARDTQLTQLTAVKSDRASKLIEFTQCYNALKDLTSKQNALEVAQFKLDKTVRNIDELKSKFKDGMDTYNSVIARYSSYETLAKESIPVIENDITQKWTMFKALWFEWKLEDIYFYLCHQFDWFKYTVGASAKSHKKFVNDLSKHGISGGKDMKSMCEVSVLIALGFVDKAHRDQITQHLNSMMDAYPFVEVEPETEQPSDPVEMGDDSNNNNNNNNSDQQQQQDSGMMEDVSSAPVPIVKDENEGQPSVEMEQSEEVMIVDDDPVQQSDIAADSAAQTAVGFDDDDDVE